MIRYVIVMLALSNFPTALPLMTYYGPRLRSNFDEQCKADWRKMNALTFHDEKFCL